MTGTFWTRTVKHWVGSPAKWPSACAASTSQYTPNADNGDYIVVINADKVRTTGNKVNDKIYYRYTGYVGGLKSQTLGELLAKHPERVIEKAVKGMLPRGPLGFAQFRKLKVYAGADHPHTAQQPKTLTL